MTAQIPSGRAVHLVIHGRVQGVFFRDSMRSEARQLAITGGVRNRTDGTVEAVVQGETAAVDTIVQWAHHGPQRAQVTQVEISPADGSYTGFEIVF